MHALMELPGTQSGRRILTGSGILAVLLAAIAWSTVSAVAQEKRSPAATEAHGKIRSLGDAKPSRKSAAAWPVAGFNRVIHIHQADGTDAGAKALYFCRPLLALEQRARELPGYPPIVLKVKPQPGGSVRLGFAVRLACEEFEAIAKARIGMQDADALRAQGLRPEQVKIEPWPITHAVVDCKLEGESEPLASSETESLASADELIPFNLTFTPDALMRFKKGFADNELLFAFAYTFEGRKVAEAWVASQAAKDIRAVVDQVVRSHLTPGQKVGSAPIFQHHLHTVERDARVRLTRVIRAQHKDLFPVLTDQSVSAASKLFELNKEYTVDELQGDKALMDAVAQYLRPLVESWSEGDSRSTKLTREDEDKRTDTRTNKANFGITIPIKGAELKVGGDVDSTVTDERRNLLRNEYGVETKKDSSGQFYVPYSIKVFKYNTGKQTTEVEETQMAFLAIGEVDQYLQDTPVSAHFTTARLKALIGQAGARPRMVGDTIEDAIARTTAALGTARDRLEKARRVHQSAVTELTAAENSLTSARNELAEASAKLPEIRQRVADQEAAVRSMPREVPAVQGPIRGFLGGGPPRVPMKPNPDLPAQEQRLNELRAEQDRSVAAEAAASVKVGQGATAAATARASVDHAAEQLETAQTIVTRLEAKLAALKDLLQAPPRP